MVDGIARRTPWYFRWYGITTIAMAVLVVGVFVGGRNFLYQPFSAPSDSMDPALRAGDHFLVDKRAYGYGPYTLPYGIGSMFWPADKVRATRLLPMRGDVVVFRLPTNVSVDYVKRVIGLPGDRVQMRDGKLFLNNAQITSELSGLTDVRKILKGRKTIPGQIFQDILPSGRTFVVFDARPRSFSDQTTEFHVPDGHVFVLGDNRDNSTDSRFQRDVGFVPLENLIGRASWIFRSRHSRRQWTRVN